VGLGRALQKQGQDITIYATDLVGPAAGWGPPRRGLEPAVTARRLRAEGLDARIFPVGWPSRYAYAPHLGRALRREVGAFDLAHIHSMYLYPTWAAAHACRQAGVPYILRPHGTLTSYQTQHRRRAKQIYDRTLGRGIVDGASLLHFTSEQEKSEAEVSGYIGPSRVVRLGISTEIFADLPPRGRFRARHAAINARPVVLFLGRLAPKKGIDLLLPAFAAVRERCPEAHLVLAGPDDNGYAHVVRRLVDRYGVNDCVTFTGLLAGEGKLAALRDADVWTLPSYAENFGVAVVEAMAAGLPVVISDRVDIHPEVTAAEAGVVVPCAVEPLAEALQRLLENPGERARLGAQARRVALARYSWDAVATEVVSMYEAAVDGWP
jgi:glycosyltransferase involved in cell wall biosynthesis